MSGRGHGSGGRGEAGRGLEFEQGRAFNRFAAAKRRPAFRTEETSMRFPRLLVLLAASLVCATSGALAGPHDSLNGKLVVGFQQGWFKCPTTTAGGVAVPA